LSRKLRAGGACGALLAGFCGNHLTYFSTLWAIYWFKHCQAPVRTLVMLNSCFKRASTVSPRYRRLHGDVREIHCVEKVIVINQNRRGSGSRGRGRGTLSFCEKPRVPYSTSTKIQTHLQQRERTRTCEHTVGGERNLAGSRRYSRCVRFAGALKSSFCRWLDKKVPVARKPQLSFAGTSGGDPLVTHLMRLAYMPQLSFKGSSSSMWSICRVFKTAEPSITGYVNANVMGPIPNLPLAPWKGVCGCQRSAMHTTTHQRQPYMPATLSPAFVPELLRPPKRAARALLRPAPAPTLPATGGRMYIHAHEIGQA
jgi:hypothetical protein